MYRLYRQPLLHYVIRNFTRDRDSAEDIVQMAFLKAYLNIEKFDETKNFKTWLFKIAINLSKTFVAKPVSESIEEGLLVADISTSSLNPRLEKALKEIGLANREILVMHYFNDYSYKEIGLRLKIPAYSAKARIRYAENFLKRKYYIDI